LGFGVWVWGLGFGVWGLKFTLDGHAVDVEVVHEALQRRVSRLRSGFRVMRP